MKTNLKRTYVSIPRSGQKNREKPVDLKKENYPLSYFDNNNGRTNYNGNLKSISKYKFSKIEKFDEYEPEIIINQNNIIFFDNKGTILKFDENSKLLWKKNYYTKIEKKLKPILFLLRLI